MLTSGPAGVGPHPAGNAVLMALNKAAVPPTFRIRAAKSSCSPVLPIPDARCRGHKPLHQLGYSELAQRRCCEPNATRNGSVIGAATLKSGSNPYQKLSCCYINGCASKRTVSRPEVQQFCASLARTRAFAESIGITMSAALMAPPATPGNHRRGWGRTPCRRRTGRGRGSHRRRSRRSSPPRRAPFDLAVVGRTGSTAVHRPAVQAGRNTRRTAASAAFTCRQRTICA